LAACVVLVVISTVWPSGAARANHLRGEHAARAPLVVDNDGLLRLLADRGAERARQLVGRAARRLSVAAQALYECVLEQRPRRAGAGARRISSAR
jgi:hypothetical protein